MKKCVDSTTNRVEKAVALFKGGLNCSQSILAGFGESLGCDISTPAGFEEAKQKGLLTTVCPKMVRDAGEILEQLL